MSCEHKDEHAEDGVCMFTLPNGLLCGKDKGQFDTARVHALRVHDDGVLKLELEECSVEEATFNVDATDPETVIRDSIRIAGEICLYTNTYITVETLG